MKKLVIDQYDDHQRIDKYLKKVLVQAPSSLIYKMLRKKDVKVNGKRVKENYILHSGDEVELFFMSYLLLLKLFMKMHIFLL